MSLSNTKQPYIYKIAFLVSLLVFITPFIVISFFNLPAADDFGRVYEAAKYDSFFQQMNNWYINQNGRYFNAIITSVSFWYQPLIYKLTPILFGAFFYFSIGKLLKRLMPDLYIWHRRLVQLYVVIFFLATISSVVEGFFWFAAIVGYLFPISLVLLLLTNILKVGNGPKPLIKDWLIAALLIFVAIGSHEVTMALIDFILVMALLYYLPTTNRKRLYLFALTMFSACCSLIVVLSPGGRHRHSRFPHAKDFMFSLKNAFFDTVNFVNDYAISNPFIVVLSLLLLILACVYLKDKKEFIKINPVYTSFLVVMVPFIIAFVTYYAQGSKKIGHADRVFDLFLFYFYLFWFINLYFIAAKMMASEKGNQIAQLKWVVPFLAIFLLFSLSKRENLITVYKDLMSGSAQQYYAEWVWRQNYLKSSHASEVVLVPKYTNPPKTIFFDDLSDDKNNWKNNYFSWVFTPGKKVKLIDVSVNDFIKYQYVFTDDKYWADSTSLQVFGLKESNAILYVMPVNYTGIDKRVFLHIEPESPNYLKEELRTFNFENLDFTIAQKIVPEYRNRWYVIKTLPNYPIKEVRTGQLIDGEKIWCEKFDFSNNRFNNPQHLNIVIEALNNATPNDKLNEAIYIEAENILVFKLSKDVDSNEKFMLHITPVNVDDLGEERKQYGFSNMDFYITTEALLQHANGVYYFYLYLPNYSIAKIETGQFKDAAVQWKQVLSIKK